ncbi:MAG: competence/damage-inducible protein A [Bacteroidetes bacterium]|nr:competence/damage-inducible protein A [Bacteroidota bacterium]
MKAAIISIGDELLIGQTVNTNAAWLGKELSSRGIPVYASWAIADDPEEIITAIDQLRTKVGLILMTGGLGPTKDDLTKHTLTKYFNTELEIVPEVLVRIEEFFAKRGREMLDVNVQQAALPKDCTVLHNYHGTACGMWFEKDGCVIISMPGVPYEMKGIMMDEVFPKLKDHFELSEIYHQTLMTQGIGESFLAEQFKDWETKVRDRGFGLAYLPSPGLVRLRITSNQGKKDATEIQNLLTEVFEELPRNAYCIGEKSIFEFVGDLLKKNKMTIGTIESCTGGHIAEQIVSIPGSSVYFEGGIIAYSYDQKVKLVGVNQEDLLKHGAVSEEIIRQMATNGRLKLGVDVCIATSGIAGPDGGTEDKPVGSVWIAVATKDEVVLKLFRFGDNRERNIHMTALSAMNLVRCQLQGISFEKKID